MKKVAVVMGSDSDWPVVKAACQQLDAFGIPYEAHILSAHRSPAAAGEQYKKWSYDSLPILPQEWQHTWRALLPAIPRFRL